MNRVAIQDVAIATIIIQPLHECPQNVCLQSE